MAFTIAVAAAMLVPLLPQPSQADTGHSHLTVRGTVGAVTVNPNLSLTLSVDKSGAIPGDTLGYSGTVTHTGITACITGSFTAQNTGAATATVADFFDEIDYLDPKTLQWVPLVGYVNTRSAFIPVVTPRVSTGVTLTVTGAPANGVTYPSSGDPVVGTTIAPNATAAWSGSVCLTLTAAQLKALASSPNIREQNHMEDTPGDTGEAWTENASCPNPLQSGFLNARNIVVTVTPPSGPAAQITSSTVPAFGSLAPGASANYSTTYRVPVGASRGSSETEAAYVQRLTTLDGSSLAAGASLTATGPTGQVSATAPGVTTTEHLPIVSIAKSGPPTATAGTTAVYPLTLKDIGSAAASGIALTDTMPGGATGTITGAPSTLGATASSTGVQATFAVPATQTQGNLTDTATVGWQDANANAYGTLSSSFTTVVQNQLLGARLVLALSAGSAGLNPINGSQVIQITLTNSGGAAIAGQSVTVSVTGANPMTLTAVTDANGQATVTFTGKAPGVDQLQATATAAATTIQSNTVTVNWIQPMQPISTTPALGNFYAESPGATAFLAKPGDPAAFQQTFSTINFNPPANTIPHNVSGVGPTTTPFTDVTTDANGNFAGTTVAQGNGLQAGVGTLVNFNAVLTANFVVSQPQDVTFNIVADDGFILGVSGGATHVSGTLTGAPAATAFNNYSVVGAYNTGGATSPGTYPVTIHFPTAGAYPYELDYFECCGSQLSLTMTVVSVNTGPYNLSTAYGDTVHPAGSSSFPFPWNGSSNTTFVGDGGPYDTGGLRFDNNTNQPITLNHVTVDIGTHHHDPCNLNLTVPANGTLVLAGAGSPSSFDTSEANGQLKSGGGGGSAGFLATQWATGFPSGGGVGPVGVAFDPGGTLFVMDYQTGFLYKFGAAGGAVSSATQVNANSIQGCPAGLAFSKDGKHLFVARRCSGDALEIDPATGNVIRTMSSNLPAATGIATDPLSGDLFVSEPNGGSGIVRIANPTSATPGAPTMYTATNADGIAFGPDGTLYGAVFGQGVALINGTNTSSPGTIRTQIVNSTTLAGTDGIALLPPPPGATGTSIVLNSNNGFIVQIDNPTTTPTYHNLVTGGSRGDFATVGPDGCLYATQTSSVEKVTASDGSCPFIPSICLPNSAVPQVHVAINGFVFTYNDAGKALNNAGIDGECNGTNESQAWQQIGGKGGPVNMPLPPAVTLALQAGPAAGHIVGQSETVTVAAIDGSGHAVPNVRVQLGVNGANPQQQPPSATTDTAGTVTFTYTGANPGTDTIGATAFISGLRTVSNSSPIQWTVPAPGGPTGGTSGPAPPSVVLTAPADGTVASTPTAVTATVTPASSSPLASWNVTYQNVSGGTPVIIGSGNGAPPVTLATFDPTSLAAGTYAITVNAATSAGGGASAVVRVIVGGAAGGGTTAQAPPTITTPSPADGAIVTKPVPVTASIKPPSGQTIASWSVTTQALDVEPIVTLASGTGTPPSTLGTFDPTRLPNDTYAITITATASGGGTQTLTTTVAVFGSLKLGRYVTTYQDLSVPVNGFQMQVRRTYDSFDKRVGDFGIGWHVDLTNFRVSANRQLGAGGWTEYPTQCIFGICWYAFKTSTPQYVSVAFPDGHLEIFDFTPQGGAGILYWQGSAAFTARAGTGTTSTLEVAGDSGLSYDFAGNLGGGSGYYNPTRFKLTTHDGRALILDTVLGLVSETDRNGNSLSVDAQGVHASNGQSITFARDSLNRIIQMTGPSGQVLAYAYSGSGDLATSTDPRGSVSTYSYDANHDLLKSTGPTGPLQSLQYDSAGRLNAVTDALGHTTAISSNVAGQQQTIVDALGTLTSVLTYDDLGDVVRRDLAAGGKTLTSAYQFDSIGHLLKATDPLGHSGSFTYDSAGDVLQSTDALGNTSSFTYDTFGHLLSATAPDGTTLETLNYDGNGNLVKITRNDGATLAYTYDSAGRIINATDFRGKAQSMSYDSVGHVAATTDPLGNTTQFATDASGRITSLTDPLGAVTKIAYDANGNRTSTTDGRGHSQTVSYDGQDRVTSATDQLGHATSVSYDAVGKLSAVTNRDGKVATFTYDADGRLTAEALPGNDSTTYSYDPLGEVLSAGNASITLNFTYDAAGQLTSQATAPTATSPQPSATLAYAHDAAGRLVSGTGPDGAIAYGYDSNSRLSSLTDPAGGIFGFSYDSIWRVTGLSRPNGVNDAISYDASGNLLSRTASLGATALYNAAYSYDSNGRRATFADPSGTSNYSFNAAGELTAAAHPAGGLASEQFAYDAAGNRTASASMATGSFGYDGANRLLSDARSSYSYDNEGDLTSKTDKATGAVTTYAWNMRHQLTSITFPDGTTSTYRYDPLGRRIESNVAGVVTRDVYDGQNVRLRYDGSNTLTASFVDAGVDGHLEETQAGQRLFYLQDGSNSTVQLTNSSGTSVASYAYDSFGNPAVSNSASPTNPFTYTGREFEGKSGLYYYRSRYYAADQGRFISEDPIGHLNAYTYTQNDPVDFADPSGALAVEYQALNVSMQRANVASCISSVVGAVAEVAAAGVSAAFDQPGAAASQAAGAMATGAVDAGVSCALAAIPGGASEESSAVADDFVVVRGGTKPLPPAGEVFSGAAGRTVEEAASGVPHGIIRSTTAGRIRAAGGSVEFKPELTRSGVMNDKHVNICMGPGECPFGDPFPNPVKPRSRIH